MPNSKARKTASEFLEPLPEALQLGMRVYKTLMNGIITGNVEPGTQLQPVSLAHQLNVSTTPVREAMQRLESDGLIVKLPYQGWFVREFTEQQIHELYEFRAALERLSVRLACKRITGDEIRLMRSQQTIGEAALNSNDMDAYRRYNRDFHGAILNAASNSYLKSAMGQVALQSELLTTQTIRIVGRPLRAIEEHKQIIDLIEQRRTEQAEKLMEFHILNALNDIVHSKDAGAAKQEPAFGEIDFLEELNSQTKA